VLRHDRGDEVVGGSDVCQNERWVFNVRVGGDDLSYHLEGTVCSFLAVVWCSCQVDDNQSVCCWVRFWEDGFLLGFLLALNLCEFPQLFLYDLYIGWCSDLGGFVGAGCFGRCWVTAGMVLVVVAVAVGVGCGELELTCLVNSVPVSVRWRICFCIFTLWSLMSWRPGSLTLTGWFVSWCFISSRSYKLVDWAK